MDWRMSVSSLIFIFVTVVKLIFPAQTEYFRQQTVALIDMDMDYSPFVTEVGHYLTKESAYEVIGDAQIEINIIKPNHSTMTNDVVSKLEIPKDHKSEEIESRIEEFMLAQEAYSKYETPENVAYGNILPSFDYVPPVKGVCSSGFGYRVHPIDGVVSFHYGTDYDVKEGTDVYSFGNGVVRAVGEEAGYGKYICIDHEEGWSTLYAHCSEVYVSSGQEVKGGNVIGASGSTGRVTGPHLHFELMCNGNYTNPEFYFA